METSSTLMADSISALCLYMVSSCFDKSAYLSSVCCAVKLKLVTVNHLLIGVGQ